MRKAGFADQSTKVTPLTANGADPPPLIVQSKRLAASRPISAGSSGLAMRRGVSLRPATGSPSGAIVTNGRSVSPASPRNDSPAVAPASPGISIISSNRAPGPIGNWLRKGSNGSPGWPSTATMSVFAPSTPIVATREVAALPRRRRTRAPGRAVSFNGAGPPLANTRPPLRPAPRADAGSAKSSLIWPRPSTLQSDSTTAKSRSTLGFTASSTMIGPNIPRPCWPASDAPPCGR